MIIKILQEYYRNYSGVSFCLLSLNYTLLFVTITVVPHLQVTPSPNHTKHKHYQIIMHNCLILSAVLL